MTLLEILHYGFVQRALITGVLTALNCALLGVFLVPRRFSMVGDGLAHFALASIGFSLLIRIHPLAIMIPALMIAALIILHLPERAALYGDAAIGMVSVVGVAAGVMMASLGQGFNVDLFSYLFGDILSVSRLEMWCAAALSLLVSGLIVALFPLLFAVTFDPDQAHVLGVRPERLDRVLALLAALTVAIGIKTAGTMLLSSLLIFPAAAALQVARSFRTALALAALLGVLSVVAGIFAAFLLDWPAGATIALTNATLFVLLWGFSRRSR